MKYSKKILFLAFALSAALITPACKAKKALVQPPAAPAPEPVKTTPPPVSAPTPAATPAPQRAAAMAPTPKPDYNFSNIQFEFNSAVLKTSAYPILDKAVMEMKKDATVKFNLNGYASAEGTAEHNMTLSAERANAVKTYLMNAGINSYNLTANGYGQTNPISQNTDEAGRAINRRVEIKKM